ncbi:MAG: DUF1499 domain-containing protein [Albidovulum sp.]
MKKALIFALCAILAGMAYVRLAPTDLDYWHAKPAQIVPVTAGWRGWVLYPPEPTDGVQQMPGGAFALKRYDTADAAALLTRLDQIIRATPHTTLLAGSPQEGRMTWITRSRVWGFPDYTSAEAIPNGAATDLQIAARLRFGSSDLGTNAARLKQWLADLEP